jgi:hypothetical protein
MAKPVVAITTNAMDFTIVEINFLTCITLYQLLINYRVLIPK